MATRTKRLTLNDTLVVDVDVHAHDTPEALTPYIDAEWRPVLEKFRDVPRRYLDLGGYSAYNSIQGAKLPGVSLPSPRGNSRIEIVYTAEQMRRELDDFSIDVGIIFPDHHLRIAGLPNANYAKALSRAYHHWLKEEWFHEDNDLYGVIIAIPQDVEEAVREIERWGNDERFVGVFLPTCEMYPLWGHRKFDPIYEAAQRYDLPVFLHAVAGMSSGFPYNLEAFTTAISTHTIAHSFAMMAHMLSMMETGVPVRYPDLRICFCEAGLTWVPFLRMRVDKEFNENRYQWPHFNDRPSKWIKKFYFATQPVEEPENKQDLVDIIRIYDGDDTTVFASDWPHHDFDHPRAVFDLPVSEVSKRKIMGANALKLMPRIKIPVKYQDVYKQGETL